MQANCQVPPTPAPFAASSATVWLAPFTQGCSKTSCASDCLSISTIRRIREDTKRGTSRICFSTIFVRGTIYFRSCLKRRLLRAHSAACGSFRTAQRNHGELTQQTGCGLRRCAHERPHPTQKRLTLARSRCVKAADCVWLHADKGGPQPRDAVATALSSHQLCEELSVKPPFNVEVSGAQARSAAGAYSLGRPSRLPC